APLKRPREERPGLERAAPAFVPSAAEAAAARAAEARESATPRAGRLRAGTVHTPPWLSHVIARAADQLLRDELGLAQGLAHARLGIVDPACGPGVFLASALAIGAGR